MKPIQDITGRILSELCLRSIQALGRTWPNPSVACVLTDGKSFYSGATEPPSRRHAEIAALDLYDSDSGRLQKAGLYVTLEPCSRTGRTPPCTDRILKYPEIESIHVYRADPSLSGEGFNRLSQAGKRVYHPPGLLYEALKSGATEALPVDCTDPGFFLNGFVNRMRASSPRLHLKAAVTADGMTGNRDGRLFISGENAKVFTMMLRAKFDAVVAGPGTVAADLSGLDLRSEIFNREKAGLFADDLKLPYDTDVITRSILSNLDTLFDDCEDASLQPDRVFILGRDFPGREQWIQKQDQITRRTGRDAVYLVLNNSRTLWEAALKPAAVLPDMHDSVFTKNFRQFLASRGYNEILVEGGSGLFSALQPGLTHDDRIYLLQSKSAVSDGPGGAGLPDFMRPVLRRRGIDLVQDILYCDSASGKN